MRNKGITLVALVVTIIIMLILAGVTIGAVIGNNGLIARTKKSGELYSNAQKNELDTLGKIDEKLDEIVSEKTKYIKKSVDELKAGEYVNYTDSYGIDRKCIVLYDKSSEYGLQIITDKTVETVNLGGGVGNVNSTKQEYYAARDSYNNAVIYLNDQANKYVNLNYSEEKSARSVGTMPNNPYLEVDYMTANFSGDKFRAADTYYTIDIEQLEKLNIVNINENYFLASRDTYYSGATIDFRLRHVNTNGVPGYTCVVSARITGTVYGRTLSYGLRPIFKLKDNLYTSSGDGSFDNPYKFDI